MHRRKRLVMFSTSRTCFGSPPRGGESKPIVTPSADSRGNDDRVQHLLLPGIAGALTLVKSKYRWPTIA